MALPGLIGVPARRSPVFDDRTDAGRQLAAAVREAGVDIDIVLAIPRGGLPVGRAVADSLDLPLDIVAARKLGAPHNPELAIGAAGAEGAIWLNDDLVDRLDVDDTYVESERDRQAENARKKRNRYREGRPPLDLAGRAVLIVDDGVATGATVRACVNDVREAGADNIVVAVPVTSPNAVADLRSIADDVIFVEAPSSFSAVGQFYRRFDQVSDDEAMAYLDDS